ncbi:hypothetical protein [Paraburkholderia ultramafica]|uniref:hypothetical protein n=1 Tax=Paraburkholderia ultramafica TaxID=1544867 RepID=UPI001582F7EE|nr:hypothetical protein [Paraburkholderia ultramafica]
MTLTEWSRARRNSAFSSQDMPAQLDECAGYSMGHHHRCQSESIPLIVERNLIPGIRLATTDAERNPRIGAVTTRFAWLWPNT